MLSHKERALLSQLNIEKVWEDMLKIASFSRLSGSEGEKQAVEYITSRLDEEKVDFNVSTFPARLSNPIKSKLSCIPQSGISFEVPCKTWSFTSCAGVKFAGGWVRFIEADFPRTLEEFLVRRDSRNKDLEGIIVISETSNPFHLLSLQDRGASGCIFSWETGDEEQIHEGNVNMIWGTPLPEELGFYLKIPFVAVNRSSGQELISLAEKGLFAEILVENEEKVAHIPIIEAEIGIDTNKENYLLVGNHIDSWHYGACDNATGNALAINLASMLEKEQSGFLHGVKVGWWSGHSNGRYAGSSIYSEKNYEDILRNCIAYMNIDMPGLKGANDYSNLTVGPDFQDIAQDVLLDINGTRGKDPGLVRGWDQSFQNMGISPYFIWASTLPETHEDTTGGSFMSWWWHTEKDLPQYCDKQVLKKDFSLYAIATLRLLATSGDDLYSAEKLFDSVISQLLWLQKSLIGIVDLGKIVTLLSKCREIYQSKQNQNQLSFPVKKRIISKLNQIYYVQKGEHLQDYALPQKYIPAISRAIEFNLKNKYNQPFDNLYLNHYLQVNKNRISSLVLDLLLLLEQN